jgi:hypothetical protein
MSRIKSALVKASGALALAVALGAALWPELVTGRVDEALSACWRVAGDRLVDRELDAIARQLVRDRQDVERLEALRDRLDTHLRALTMHRGGLAARVDGRCPPIGADPERELARLDAALARLDSTSGRADRMLDRARGDIRDREGELIALRAAADAGRMDRALAVPVGDPRSCSTRVARAREYLRLTLPDGEGTDDRPELDGPP